MTGTTPDEGIARYMTEADPAVLKVCGVSYKDFIAMAPAMDPGSRLITMAAARQIPPPVFAATFLKIHQLASSEKVGADRAEHFNLTKAAIIAFGSSPARSAKERRQSPLDWKLGSDGLAYGSMEDGRLLRLSVANKGDNWGFSVTVSEVAVLLTNDPSDVLRRSLVPATVPFTPAAKHIDIGEAVQDALVSLAPPPAPKDLSSDGEPSSGRRFG